MVSDARRLQLNREFFGRQVHRQWQAYTAPRPEPWQLLWRVRSASAAATLRALLPAGAAVLEVGCGTGQLSLELAAAGFAVTAVELVEEMLRIGQRANPDIRWLHAPFTDSVAARGEFDAVVALGYLEYQERAGKELVRMGRLLKPGGLLVLSVPNTLSGQFAFGVKRAAFRLGKEPEDVMLRHSFTPERLQRLLGMAGYILMDYQWLDPRSAPLALRKDRERDFWSHRLKDRLKPEMLTLSRTFLKDDTTAPQQLPEIR
jgi:2-polyprenyl-3-methyl-5-hydroxy-6-metoxy-1,4-benzoquinol methylase